MQKKIYHHGYPYSYLVFFLLGFMACAISLSFYDELIENLEQFSSISNIKDSWSQLVGRIQRGFERIHGLRFWVVYSLHALFRNFEIYGVSL